jgi:hypothetical protein
MKNHWKLFLLFAVIGFLLALGLRSVPRGSTGSSEGTTHEER